MVINVNTYMLVHLSVFYQLGPAQNVNCKANINRTRITKRSYTSHGTYHSHCSYEWKNFISQTIGDYFTCRFILNYISRVPVEGKSSVCLICMKYRIIILIIIIISLGQILLSYIENNGRRCFIQINTREGVPVFRSFACFSRIKNANLW